MAVGHVVYMFATVVGRCGSNVAKQRNNGAAARGAVETMAITANMHINGNLLSNARANDSESTGRAGADREAAPRCLTGALFATVHGSLLC